MASIVNTSTKVFTSEMAGAPVLNNAAGSLLAILEACLVTGFGIKAITSVVIAGGVATVGFTAPASAAIPESVIAISGITGTYAALNGEQKIKTTSTTSVTFATDMPDGIATLSSASFKMAPLGWEKTYAGTNKAVFRPLDVASTRPYLRILDTAASPATGFHARGLMYESMTDVDTGVNQAPPNTNVPNGGYWWKTNVNTSVAQSWMLVGDSRGFYYIPATHSSGTGGPSGSVHYFGDINSFKSGDNYCGAMLCGVADVTATAFGPNVSLDNASVWNGVIMRHYNGLGGAVNLGWRVVGGGPASASGNDSSGLGPYPNQANNGLLLGEIVLGRAALANYGLRGRWPGIVGVPMSGANGAFPRGTVIDGVGQWLGSKLIAATGGANLSVLANDFPFFFDITKNWRA